MSDFREVLNTFVSRSPIYDLAKWTEIKFVSLDAFREKCGFPIVPAESEENPQ